MSTMALQPHVNMQARVEALISSLYPQKAVTHSEALILIPKRY